MRETIVLALLLLAMSHTIVVAQSALAAKVGDRSITVAEIEAKVRAQLRPLEEQMYAIRRRAVEQFIVEQVLQAEAARVGTTTPNSGRPTSGTSQASPSRIPNVRSIGITTAKSTMEAVGTGQGGVSFHSVGDT